VLKSIHETLKSQFQLLGRKMALGRNCVDDIAVGSRGDGGFKREAGVQLAESLTTEMGTLGAEEEEDTRKIL
jgi:hypothetical protein